MRFGDIVSGAAFLGLAIALWFMSVALPNPASQIYGPAIFPKVIAICLGLSALILLVKSLDQIGKVPLAVFDDWIRDPQRVLQFLLVPATVVFYVYMVEQTGFLLTAFIMLLVLQLALRVRLITTLIVSIAMVALIYAIFDMMLGVPLPRGELFYN